MLDRGNAEMLKLKKEQYLLDPKNFSSEEFRWNSEKLAEMDEDGLLKLNDSLKKYKNVTTLDLPYNGFGENEKLIDLVVKLLEDNPQIISIDLSYNKITDKFIQKILKSDLLLSRLKDLDIELDCNQITKKGLMLALHRLSDVTIYTMTSGNPINDSTFVEKCLTEALYKPNKKQKLEAAEKEFPAQPSQAGVFSPSSKLEQDNVDKSKLLKQSNGTDNHSLKRKPGSVI